MEKTESISTWKRGEEHFFIHLQQVNLKICFRFTLRKRSGWRIFNQKLSKFWKKLFFNDSQGFKMVLLNFLIRLMSKFENSFNMSVQIWRYFRILDSFHFFICLISVFVRKYDRESSLLEILFTPIDANFLFQFSFKSLVDFGEKNCWRRNCGRISTFFFNIITLKQWKQRFLF